MSESTPKPTVGRVVNYHGSKTKGTPYPAIVTHVWSDDCVNLNVLNDGTYPIPGVDSDAALTVTSCQRGDELGQWNWMPYQLKKSHGSESGEVSAGTESI